MNVQVARHGGAIDDVYSSHFIFTRTTNTSLHSFSKISEFTKKINRSRPIEKPLAFCGQSQFSRDTLDNIHGP